MSTTELQALNDDVVSTIEKIESIVDVYSLPAIKGESPMRKSLLMATGMRKLRAALTPEVMADIMPLMNTPLGFNTDKDPSRPTWSKQKNKMVTPQPYSEDAVKTCVIQALMRGLYLVGNEFNIISGSQYTTREGFERITRELPGVSNIVIRIGAIDQGTGDTCRVSFSATWTLDGAPQSIVGTKDDKDAAGNPLDSRVPVRINAGMGADAVIGKAHRKVWALIYQNITGQNLDDHDSTAEADPNVVDAKATTVVTEPTETERDDSALAAALAAAKTLNDVLLIVDGLQTDDEVQNTHEETLCRERYKEILDSEPCVMDWKRVNIELGKAELIGDVRKVMTRWSPFCGEDEDLSLAELCRCKEDDIREARGERSNA